MKILTKREVVIRDQTEVAMLNIVGIIWILKELGPDADYNITSAINHLNKSVSDLSFAKRKVSK